MYSVDKSKMKVYYRIKYYIGENYMIFNQELKEKFIDYTKLNYEDKTVKARETIINAINSYENKINKSILDLNKDELINFFSDLNFVSMGTLDASFSHIKAYILFCGEYTENANLSINYFNRKELASLINAKLKYKRYITLSEYEVYCERDCNAQDTALLILLWNGVYGINYSDIINIKTKQFNFEDGTLTLDNGTILHFTNRENELLKLAKDEQYYKQYDSKDRIIKETPYIDGDYFIKHTLGVANKNTNNNQVPDFTIKLRLTRYFSKIYSNNLAGYNVYISGLINRCIKDNSYNLINTKEMQNQIKEFAKISYNTLSEAKTVIEEKLYKEGLMNLNVRKKADKKDLETIIKKYINGEIKYIEAVESSGISNSTFSRKLKKYREKNQKL